MAPGINNLTVVEAVSYRGRQAEALRLAREGYTWPEVARRAGFNSKQAAHQAVERALRAIIKEPVQEFIAAKLAEIEIAKAKWWPHTGPEIETDEKGVATISDKGLRAFLSLFDRECALRGVETRSPKINLNFFPPTSPPGPALPELPDDPERLAAIAFHVRELRALYAGQSTGLVVAGEPGSGGSGAMGDIIGEEASGLVR